MQTLRLINVLSVAILLCAFNAFAKPGAAISLQSPSSYQLEPYSNAQITLEFSLPANAEKLQVQMQTQGSAKILNQEPNQNILLNEAQTLFSMPLEIESADAGVDYLMFNFILTYKNGLSEARSLGVRLQVGAELQKNKLQSKPATENRYKELPAQEMIISN